MVESKTDELKKQTTEVADKAEDKVKGGVDAVEHSKAGKFIPTHFENIEFKTVIYAAIVLSILTTIPIYLMFCVQQGSKPDISFLFKLYKWCFLIFGLLSSGIDIAIIALKFEKLSKLIMVTKLIKIVLLIISIFIITFSSFIQRLLYILDIAGVVLLEVIIVYYVVMFFNRLHSESFDDEGNPKNRDGV